MPRGTLIPYHAERFRSTSHIAPSIPAVEATSHVRPRLGVSNPIRIPEPRKVTIGNTTYIVHMSLRPLFLVLQMLFLPLIHVVLRSGMLLLVIL